MRMVECAPSVQHLTESSPVGFGRAQPGPTDDPTRSAMPTAPGVQWTVAGHDGQRGGDGIAALRAFTGAKLWSRAALLLGGPAQTTRTLPVGTKAGLDRTVDADVHELRTQSIRGVLI